MKTIKIGNAQAFWGDSDTAAARLLEAQPDLDFITLDYLSELSLSIMAIQQEKDRQLGYAQDFIRVIKSLSSNWKKKQRTKVIANAGGLNPIGCAHACAEALKKEGCGPIRIGIVTGDNSFEILQSNPTNPLFHHLETNKPLTQVIKNLVTANAYMGARPIADALSMGADIVITGRVADPSLTVGPCAASFQWDWNDFNRIAGATVAGHLIECGTQVTGGFSTNWLEIPHPTDMGFPIVEVDEDGSCIVTKPKNSGGAVNIETVKEQLLYEIGDPGNYLSPDAIVSFLTLQVSEEKQDRVRVKGATGRAPPSSLKVSATYRDGFKAEAFIAIFGRHARKKAKICGEIVLKRVKMAGYELEQSLVECLGTGDIVPGVKLWHEPPEPMECLLRICVMDSRREALDCFAREIAPLVTSGPQGVTGYSSGRPKVRPVFGYWPCLIEASQVRPKVEVIETS